MEEKFMNETRALNNDISMIAKRLKFFARNEKMIGTQISTLNSKLKTLKSRFDEISPSLQQKGRETEKIESTELVASSSALKAIAISLNEIKKELTFLRENTISKEEFEEIKFLVNTLDPLKFATIDQVKELIEKNKK